MVPSGGAGMTFEEFDRELAEMLAAPPGPPRWQPLTDALGYPYPRPVPPAPLSAEARADVLERMGLAARPCADGLLGQPADQRKRLNMGASLHRGGAR